MTCAAGVCSRSTGSRGGVLVVGSAVLETALLVIVFHAYFCLLQWSIASCCPVMGIPEHAKTCDMDLKLRMLHLLPTGLGVRGVVARRVWPPPSSTRGSVRRASCWTSSTCSRRRGSGCPTSCRWVWVVWGEA